MDPITLSAIKKLAKDLKQLKDGTLPTSIQSIIKHLEEQTAEILNKLDYSEENQVDRIQIVLDGIAKVQEHIGAVKTSFEEWKLPWTTARANKLDKLDNLDHYTESRAVKIDNLDVPISTRQSETDAKNRYEILKANSIVKRIQSGVIKDGADLSVFEQFAETSFYAFYISLPYEVNLARSQVFIYFTGLDGLSNQTLSSKGCMAELVSEKSLRIVLSNHSIIGGTKFLKLKNCHIRWEVVEWR